MFPCSDSLSDIRFSDALSRCLLERLGSGTEQEPIEGTPNEVPPRSCGSFNFWLEHENAKPARLQLYFRPPDGAKSAHDLGMLVQNAYQGPMANLCFA